MDYSLNIQSELELLGVRVKVDGRNEKHGYKIREAQMQKIQHMIVIEFNEVKENTINLRKFGEQQSISVPLEEFKNTVVQQIKERII